MSKWIKEIIVRYDDKQSFIYGNTLGEIVGELVRCKECKYEPICTHSVQHTTHEPTSVTIGYKTVEWCSYGERKESE